MQLANAQNETMDNMRTELTAAIKELAQTLAPDPGLRHTLFRPIFN